MVMQALMDEGVLMAANEMFFWPLGLALAWTVEDGSYQGELHVREWVYEDGHHERIELADDDEVGVERRKKFGLWLSQRIASMPEDERGPAQVLAQKEGATQRPDPTIPEKKAWRP